jgi:hypothetical protein
MTCHNFDTSPESCGSSMGTVSRLNFLIISGEFPHPFPFFDASLLPE